MRKTLILSNNEYKKWNEKIEEKTGDNLIPLMTSNTAPYGEAFSDSLYSSGYPNYYAFDNNMSTCWVSSKNAFPHYIGYKFTNKKVIAKYEVQIRSLDANDLTSAPNSWVFEGSNDNSLWVGLDTITGQTWTVKGESKVFEINNSNEYMYYRLKITSHNGYNESAVSVGNLRMFQKPSSEIPAHWSTVSSTLPTQEQFLSDGMDSLPPLLDRKVQSLPSIKFNKSEILLNNEGKVFSKTLDLKKYMDIRNIKAGAK